MFSRYSYIDFPKADTVDYSDIDEVCAYQLMLCKIFESEGGFNLPAASTPITREIGRQSLTWLREVKSIISSIIAAPIVRPIPHSFPSSPKTTSARAPLLIPDLCDIPRLLRAYDVFYRIGHGIPCYDYLREIKLKAADRWLRGDKSISRTDVVLLLLSETGRDIRTLEKRYADYSISVMTEWIDELARHGKFTGISLSETYKRLAYLLDADLFVRFGNKAQTTVKAQWAKNHILSEEQVDGLDTNTLWDYAAFVDSIPFNSSQEYERQDSLYQQLLSKIASRPDLHPYCARAVEIGLARRAALLA